MTIDRRTALAGAAGLGCGLGTMLVGQTEAAAASTPRDHWTTDAQGLPSYVFTGDVPVKTATPAGRTYPLDPDPVFLLGNYDLTLFTSASGAMQFISGERGWVHVNAPTPQTRGSAATLIVTRGGASETVDLFGPGGIAASGDRTTRTFGCGTARYRVEAAPGVSIERIISVAPSTATHRAQPAVVVAVRLTNTGSTPVDLDYAESVLAHPSPTPDGVPKRGYPIAFVNRARPIPGGIVCEATATSADPSLLTAIDVPSQYTLFPPALVLAAAPQAGSAKVEFGQRAVDDGAVELSARSRLRLTPGTSRDIVLVVALKSAEADLAPLARFVETLAPSPSGDWFRDEWARVLAAFATVPDPTLRAELVWDGHALLAMATYAAYYRQTFIPQGMTGDYVQNFNAGPRDHLQHAMAAAYFAPALARSSILYTLCRMTRDGAMKFTVSGNGLTANSTWSPSDQALFLFYALGDYLRITGDATILNVPTPFADGGGDATVLGKLGLAFTHLRDHVSVGSHGLVRMLTGDWNDQIYAGVPSGKYRDTAESQMNSAMVMAIVPPLADRLDTYAVAGSGDRAARLAGLARDLRDYAAGITRAMLSDMDGRIFARRAWLEPGRALGDETMFLEPQSFLLQAASFPVERKRALWREMQRRLLDGEVLGPRQHERPADDARMLPGTSENGAFWYSLAGQAIAGVATFDRTAALALLDRMTFRNQARHYPAYWVGRWTAPDTLNAAVAGDFAGLPRPMDDGVYCRMAAYCAHAHAWPIYSYFKVRDAS